MNRKPLPATATVPVTVPATEPTPVTHAPTTTESQAQPLSEWDNSPTTKKSFFSKPAFLSAFQKDLRDVSVEKGSVDAVPSHGSGFFARNRKKKLILGGIGALILFIFLLGLGLGLGLKKKGYVSTYS
jgi:hypothetical protein